MGWAARQTTSIENRAKGPKAPRRPPRRTWGDVPLADRASYTRRMLALALGVNPKTPAVKA